MFLLLIYCIVLKYRVFQDSISKFLLCFSLHRSEEYNHVDKLSKLGITEDSVLQFSLSSFHNEKPSPSFFFQEDVRPSVKQTQKGLSVFLSTLYAIVCENTIISISSGCDADWSRTLLLKQSNSIQLFRDSSFRPAVPNFPL